MNDTVSENTPTKTIRRLTASSRECTCVVCGNDAPKSDNRRKLFNLSQKTTACNNLEIVLGHDIGPKLSHTSTNCIICKSCYEKNITLVKKMTEVRSKYVATKEKLLAEAEGQGEISESNKRMCKDSGPDNTKIKQSRSATVSESRLGSSRELFPLNGASCSSDETLNSSDQTEETAVCVSGLFLPHKRHIMGRHFIFHRYYGSKQPHPLPYLFRPTPYPTLNRKLRLGLGGFVWIHNILAR